MMPYDFSQYHLQTGDTKDLVDKVNDVLDVLEGAFNNSLTAAPVTTAIDWGASDFFTKSMSSPTTFTFSNVPSGVAMLVMRLTVTSGATPTWPAAVIWEEGITPTFTSGKTHLIFFITEDGGTTVRGVAKLNFAS